MATVAATKGKGSGKRSYSASAAGENDGGTKIHQKVANDDVPPTKKKKGQSAAVTLQVPTVTKGRSIATATTNMPVKAVPLQMDWSNEDLEKLIENLGSLLPKSDSIKYSTQMEKVDWDKVSFGDHSPTECRQKWAQITTRVRRYRTLTELVSDAKEWVKHPWTTFNSSKSKNKHPDLPKKPLTPYFRYFLEKREKHSKENPAMSMTELAKLLAKKFSDLPEKKKQKYKDNYERDNETYKASMEQFREQHPEMFTEEHRVGSRGTGPKQTGPQKPHTPFQLFLAEKMTKHTNLDPMEKKNYEEKYRVQWRNLSDSKKVKWIRRAITEEQRFVEEMARYMIENPELKLDQLKSVVSKAEREIKERIDGKPEKPPNSGYSLYSKIMLKKLTNIPSKEKMAEISKRWKELTEKERQNYAKQAVEATERYQRDYALYLEKLPEDERKKLEEEKNKTKKKNNSKVLNSEPNADGKMLGNSKPKKPLSALFFYQQEKLDRYKEDYPDKSEQELTRMMAREYNELSEKKRDKYKKMAEMAKKAAAHAKDSSSRKGRLFKGEPKKPPQSGYLLYTTEVIANLDIEPKQRMVEISRQWKGLTAQEREKYKKRAADMMKKYTKDLSKFLQSLSEEERKIYEQTKGAGKKGNGKKDGLKKVKVMATTGVKSEPESGDEEDDDDDDDDESDKDDNDSSNDSDSESDDDSSDEDESEKSDSGSGSESKSESDSSSSDSDNTKESSASSSEDSDSEESGTDSDSGSGSDK